MDLMTMISLRLGDYAETLSSETANLIFTSPPYNIGSQSPAKTGPRKHGGYDPKSYRGIREYEDNLPEEYYQDRQVQFLYWCATRLTKNGTLVYNHKPRRKNGRMIHPMTWLAKCDFLELMEEVVWDRGSTHNHCPQMMWQHTERLYVLKRKGAKYCLRNNKALTFRSDVWYQPRSAVNGHNAPFPVELAEGVINAWCPESGTVMDPYSGSGTTAIAAINTGRQFVGSELLPKYHDLATARIERALSKGAAA